MNFTIRLSARILLNTSASRNVFNEKILQCCYSTSEPNLVTCKGSGKIVKSLDGAIAGIKDGAKLLIGGYGVCGIPENMICAIVGKGIKDLTIVSNICGVDNFGIGLLLKQKLIKRIITSFVGQNTEFEKRFLAGEIEIELTPQGTLAERIRAGGAGIPAFYTPAGLGTILQEGGDPIKYTTDGQVEITGEPRGTHQFNGKDYVLETAITGDFALVKAWKADSHGNLIFRKTARNLNPAMCRAAKFTIVEAEELVDRIDPDHVHLPGIFVDQVFIGEKYEKRIENLTLTKKTQTESALASTPAVALRERIIKRAALELKEGTCINIGIGLPMLLINHLPVDKNITVHSETGAIGLGKYPLKSKLDPEIINAERQTVTELPGASYFDTDLSFDMIRGGHVDVAVLSAMEVSQYGDIANWIVPGKVVKGIGASMDIVSAPNTKIIITMEHNMKDGSAKIVDNCSLPLTGSKCADMIITEKAVFTVHPEEGLTLVEVAEGVEIPDILVSTGCNFQVSPNLKKMGQLGEPEEPRTPPPKVDSSPKEASLKG